MPLVGGVTFAVIVAIMPGVTTLDPSASYTALTPGTTMLVVAPPADAMGINNPITKSASADRTAPRRTLVIAVSSSRYPRASLTQRATVTLDRVRASETSAQSSYLHPSHYR